jgi:Domain of unknown function (DUF4190)
LTQYPPPPPGSYPYPQGGYPPQLPRTNGYAIASMVLGILGSTTCLIGAILALVFGYKARREIDASGGQQQGRGMAIAGIVLGWVWIGLAAAYVIVVIIVAVSDSHSFE